MRFDVTRFMKLLNRQLAGGMLLVVVIACGCNDRAVVVPPEASGILPPANPPKVAVQVEKAKPIPAGQKDWLNKQALPPPRWYSLYLNGKCIGFSHYSITASETQAKLLRLTKRDVFEVSSSPTSPIQRREIVLESLELAEGRLLSYTEKSAIDGNVAETTAKVERDMLTTTKTADGKTISKSLPWPAETWGPLGTIAILQLQPMKPDDFHEAKIFVPPLEKIVKVELKCKKWEPTTIPGGLVKELLLVETRFVTGEESALTKNWVNESGEIVKSVSQGGFTMFQSTRDEAERIDSSIRAAQLMDTQVPVHATVEQLRSTNVTFSIDSTDDDPFSFLSSKVNQQVKSLSTLGATLTIQRVIPSSPISEGVPQDPPEESCLVKFSSDAEQLRKFLRELPNMPEDALSVASNLTGVVFRKLQKVPLSRYFSTPSQSIKQGKGDCKAHAILLMAALRERGIPARAASGLRIVKEKDNDQLSAIYHMWCEAWIGDRWMPLDPFAGTIGVGADHIKFSELSLNENSQMTMLDVLQHMKHLTIAVKP